MMNPKELIEYMKQAKVLTYIRLVSETGTQGAVFQFHKEHVRISMSDYEEPDELPRVHNVDSWREAWYEIKGLESQGYTIETELKVSPKSFYN